MTPEQIAAHFFNVDANTLHATRIKDGLTNESYLVTGCDYPIVVRISNADEISLQLNRHSEAVVLKLVEQAGIGASVLFNDPGSRVLITRELQGGNPAKDKVIEQDHLERVAAILRQLHSLPVNDHVQSMNMERTLQQYWQSLGVWHDQSKALQIARESDHQPIRCLCHNDVHHLNMIDNGERLWLLDWEYAAIGDPYFDLASVCCYHEFSQPQRMMLLEAYSLSSIKGEGVEKAEIERLNRMCWLFDYIKELWFAARIGDINRDQSSTIGTNSERLK